MSQTVTPSAPSAGGTTARNGGLGASCPKLNMRHGRVRASSIGEQMQGCLANLLAACSTPASLSMSLAGTLVMWGGMQHAEGSMIQSRSGGIRGLLLMSKLLISAGAWTRGAMTLPQIERRGEVGP